MESLDYHYRHLGWHWSRRVEHGRRREYWSRRRDQTRQSDQVVSRSPPGILSLALERVLKHPLPEHRYHLSRVESVEDVPEWLLNDAERASYHRRKLSHARSTQEFDRPSAPQSMRERPVARQYHSEEQLPVRRAGSENNASRGSEAQPPNFAGIGGVGRGSAADRLARMREERRMRATAM